MAYADLTTIQATDPGDPLTAAWCDQVRDNEEFFIDPPTCAIYSSSAQSVSTNTVTALTADSERFDNDSMHSTSSNTSRITIQTEGRYLLGCVVRFAFFAAVQPRLVQFRFNGNASTVVNVGQLGSVPDTVTVRDTIISGATAEVFTAGDYIEVTARQETGGSLNVTLDNFFAIFLTR